MVTSLIGYHCRNDQPRATSHMSAASQPTFGPNRLFGACRTGICRLGLSSLADVRPARQPRWRVMGPLFARVPRQLRLATARSRIVETRGPAGRLGNRLLFRLGMPVGSEMDSRDCL